MVINVMIPSNMGVYQSDMMRRTEKIQIATGNERAVSELAIQSPSP